MRGKRDGHFLLQLVDNVGLDHLGDHRSGEETREAFGEWHAFACGWFYYISNVFWIPGVLVAGIGMMTYAFSPKMEKLAEKYAPFVPGSFPTFEEALAAKGPEDVSGLSD